MGRAALGALLGLSGCLVADLDVAAYDDCLDDRACGPGERCLRVHGVRECVTVAVLAPPGPGADIAAAVAEAEAAGLVEVALQSGTYPPLAGTLVLPDDISLLGGRDAAWRPGGEATEVVGAGTVVERRCVGGDSRGRIEAVTLRSAGGGGVPAVGLRLQGCGVRTVVESVRVEAGDGAGCAPAGLSCGGGEGSDGAPCAGPSVAVVVDGGSPVLRDVVVSCAAAAGDGCVVTSCGAAPTLERVRREQG